MRKIRIGNDIQVSWEVMTGGEALSLEGRALRVWVRSAYSKQEIEEFSVEGCVVTFTYPAKMQRTTGARAVVLEDMTEGSARRTLCADEAFTLVAHSAEEDYGGCSDAQGEDFDKYLVSLKSNILVGKPGLSAYDLWLSDGHTGTMEDYMKWLQQPATDAAADVKEAEEKRVEAESGRSEAERLRDDAEAERNTNESKRKTAESERQTAFTEKMKALGDKEQEVDTAVSDMWEDVDNALDETKKKTEEAVKKATDTENDVKNAEALRANEEKKRVAAETKRVEADTKRSTAESGRATAETLRQDAEAARNAAESDRIKSEKERVKSEELRATAETDRQLAETQRTTAENNRATAEQKRAAAESERLIAERQRVAAEQTRATAFQQQTDSIATAVRNAETATEGAEKVDASLSDGNVLTITDRDGEAKSLDLASQADVAEIVEDVRHLDETMGAYTERESITLTAVEQNKAVSADGVKVSKSGWAIAEFTAEKGNVYLFKPGVTDGSVCIFAEKITSVETRGIDYTYTYNDDGTAATATATYLGKTHTYTYTWGTDAQGNKTATITEDGAEVAALPMTYETQVGTYAPLVRLNADAELPKDGYCRYMSHFKGNSAIKIAVSYKMDSADLVMKVTRDGVLASISTQLGNLSQKEDETRSKVEEYHRSYIELLFKEDWTVYVDGKAVKIPGGKKTKVYPIKEFRTAGMYANVPFQWMDVSHLDVSTFDSLYCLFNDCETLRRLDLSNWDVGNVQNMYATFFKCKSLEYLDLSGWQTERMRNLQNAFYICNAQFIGLENWDVSNVTNMAYMFAQAGNTAPLDLSGWQTAKCTDMAYAFRSCQAASINLSSWDMSATPKTSGMFQFCNPKSLLLGPRFFTMADRNFDFQMSNWTNETVRESLVTNSYDRRANGLDDLTLTLHANTKKVLTEDDIAAMTAKGYIIA